MGGFEKLAWRKSSRSQGNGACVEVALTWRKSSRSTNNGQCVEVASSGAEIAIRDTKQHGTGPILTTPTADWSAFIAAVATDNL